MSHVTRSSRLAAAIAAALSVTAPLAAQNPNIVQPSAEPTTNQSLGWIVTPAIAVSSGWDNNVFVQGDGDEATGDIINVVNPRFDATYRGRLSQFNVDYSGAFLLYREITALNSFDQRVSFNARRRLTKRVSLFAENALADVPTTEISELVGIPFVRTGSTLDAFRGGVESAFTKKTTLSLAGNFQWVRFDANPLSASQLHGGHGIGGEASLRHRISERTTLMADYSLQRALVSDTGEVFVVQMGGGGVEYQFSELVKAFGELGVARLVTTIASEARIGPSIRAGISRHATRASFQAAYNRTFVPSYGFGGTTQNEDVIASVAVPLTRRLSGQASAALRRNEPLTIGLPSLRSYWLECSLGYDFIPVARIEVYYGGAHQIIDRPGGEVTRNRIGVQVMTAKRLRIH
jgi:hypothetical protein